MLSTQLRNITKLATNGSDVMSEHMGAQTVIAVDVSPEDTIQYFEYGTNLSGFWLLLNSWNPFAKTVRVPSMGELSQKLIWVSSLQHLKTVVNKHVDLFIVPPVEHYGTLEYDKFDEIFEKAYIDAKPRVDSFLEKRPWLVS